MKKLAYILVFAFSTAILASCATEEIVPQGNGDVRTQQNDHDDRW